MLMQSNDPVAVDSGALLIAFDPLWVERSAAAGLMDPVFFRARVFLLLAAARSSPLGSLPASFALLAHLSGLTHSQFEKEHVALLEGFDFRSGLYVHAAMASLGEAGLMPLTAKGPVSGKLPSCGSGFFKGLIGRPLPGAGRGLRGGEGE